jgi:hypothetical protein
LINHLGVAMVTQSIISGAAITHNDTFLISPHDRGLNTLAALIHADDDALLFFNTTASSPESGLSDTTLILLPPQFSCCLDP